MGEIPARTQALLFALANLEDREIEYARQHGCRCSKPVEGMEDRSYPIARFDYVKSVGKPFDKIVWELVHEPGCPLDGQSGVG